ncbi:MAG: aminopeptidase [Bacteroidota bacterium]
MHHLKSLCLLFLLSFVLSCQEKTTPASESQVEVSGLDMERIGDKLIERMDLQAGEEVLLVGIPGRFDELVKVLAGKIQAVGGTYLGSLHADGAPPQSWQTEFTQSCKGLDKEALAEVFKRVDLGIMLPGATPLHMPYKVLQEQLDKGFGRTIHFHWAGAYDLNGNLLETDSAKDLFYQNVLLETDYKALAAKQLAFEEALRGQILRVTTPAGTDISFSIGDRPVTKQDGDASAAKTEQARNLIDREIELPAGAIRVAPIEETVNGSIAFPDALWNGKEVKGLIMNFEAGKLTTYEAEAGKDAVAEELEAAGEAGRSFREFAIGLNPMLAIPKDGEPWIPYYGYGSGIIRLSLGDNTELGGKVGGGYVRWNFFTDATVMIGEDIWVKDGQEVKPGQGLAKVSLP